MTQRNHSLSLKQARRQGGFILAMTILLIMGVTAISVATLFNSKTGRMTAGNYQSRLENFSAADGMVTLLSQEIINNNGAKYLDKSRYGTIDGHVWIFVNGNTITDAYNAMKAKPLPDLYVTSNYLGNDVDHDNYAAKWFGYIVPPATGNYTFFLRSDDASAFFLSTDSAKKNLPGSPICYLDTWISNWPTNGTGVSSPRTLKAGHRYYFEFFHKEGNGFDYSQVGWDGPNNFSERPLSGQYLSKYSSDLEWNGTYTVGGLPVRYQVKGNGFDIYDIAVEAVTTKVGNSKDTVFRTPLSQNISLSAKAVVPPATMDLPVIFYDFLSDGSNPEFNRPVTMGRTLGMVKPTLTDSTTTDANHFGLTRIRKPTRTNTWFNNRSCGLNMWFRDWAWTTNVYRYGPGDNCSQTIFDGTGDAWRNAKILTNLTFTLDPSQGYNTYVYSRMGNYETFVPQTRFRGDPSEFFPLDYRGQDPGGSGHNYGFCMELHTTFTHQSGLKCEFSGDDDAWAFVDNKLVIDIGGIHGAENDFLVLDDLPLTFGKTYNFDFFQCERQQVRSSSRIVTNIKMQPNLGKPVANWRRNYGKMN
jgi:fibro-slime domain-containing protein